MILINPGEMLLAVARIPIVAGIPGTGLDRNRFAKL